MKVRGGPEAISFRFCRSGVKHGSLGAETVVVLGFCVLSGAVSALQCEQMLNVRRGDQGLHFPAAAAAPPWGLRT